MRYICVTVLFVLTALVIFIITYILIGLRQIPRVHVDRTAGALVGAVLMIVFGVLTLDQAFAAIDMHTLLLLLGMMIITVYLRTAGFFELMAGRIITLSKTPMQLLILIAISSALLSALFVNDTICLLYTPIVLEVTVQLGVNPMPYLLALATSSNIGSVMTVTGNPQNMLIGIYSKIRYLSFLGSLFPVALAGIIVSIVVIRYFYRNEMRNDAFRTRPAVPEYEVNKPLLAKSLLASAGVLAAFSIGFPYSLVAAAGGVFLLLIGGVRTERVLEGVDWTLLLFFSGLFVVMHGVEVSGLAGSVINSLGQLSSSSMVGRIAALSGVSLVLSNFVSNVPAVMLLKPLTQSLGGGDIFWLALAMSSTLAGNFTLIGSVANLIVAQQARRRVEIGFMEYFRVGAVITVATIIIGVIVLAVEVQLAQGAEQLMTSDTTYKREAVVAASEAGMRSKRSEIRDPKAKTGKKPTTISIMPYGKENDRTYRIVLLCDTPVLRAKGLQGVQPLRPEEAALFIFERPEAVTFWMGTVIFPIDIVFIRADGLVARVASGCQPGSRDYYSSIEPIKWVVEVAAGAGIRTGDRVRIN